MTFFRGLSGALLCGVAVAAMPTQAQSLSQVPKVAELIAEEKKKYDAAKLKHRALELAHAEALAEAFQTEQAYKAALRAEAEAILEMQAKAQAAQVALEEARDAHDATKVRKEELRPRRGQEESQEYRAAVSAEQAAFRDVIAAERQAEAAEKSLLAQGVKSHEAEALAAAEAADRLTKAKTDLFNGDREFATVANAYVRYLYRFPPPYLQKVTISARGETKYNALWIRGTAPSTAGAESLTQLIAAEQDLLKDIADLDPIIKEQSDIRLEIAKRIRKTDPIVAQYARTYGMSRQWAVALPVIIELGGVIVDLATTGGAGTGAKLAGRAADKAIDVAIENALSRIGTATGKLAAGKAMPYTGFGESKADPGAGKPLDATGSPDAAASVVLSDSIELIISTGVSTIDYREAAKVSLKALKGKKFASNLAEGAPVALVESALKAISAGYFNSAATEAQLKMVETILRAEADHVMLEKLRAQDRELTELHRKYTIALADVRFRMSQAISRPAMTVIANREVPRRDFERGMQVRFEFSTSLSSPPNVRIGDQEVENLKSGDAGNVWTGTLRGQRSDDTAHSLPIRVTIPGAEKTALPLDSNPATLPQLDVKTLAWSGAEPGADAFHNVKIAAGFSDLTGLWTLSGGGIDKALLFIRQNGNNVTSTYVNGYGPFKKGQTDFTATLDGDRLTGRVSTMLRSQRVCPGVTWVNFSAKVSEDRLEMKGSRQGATVRFSNCSTTVSGSVPVTFTRVTDDNGNPIRELPRDR